MDTVESKFLLLFLGLGFFFNQDFICIRKQFTLLLKGTGALHETKKKRQTKAKTKLPVKSY